jgi:hypothetical protein
MIEDTNIINHIHNMTFFYPKKNNPAILSIDL